MSLGIKGLRPGDTKYRVLEAIVDLYSTNRASPTMEQIRFSVGLATRSGVHFHVSSLEELGLVSQSNYRYKTIKPTKKGFKYIDTMKRVVEEYESENLF